MKSSVYVINNDLEQKLSGLISLLDYRYGNICVKATPVALLPVKVELEDGVFNFEDAADVVMVEEDPYVMQIFPKDENNIFLVGKGIAIAHPEFKQEIKRYELESETELKYILLTMPEVDENRKKVMRESVKLLYDDCKVRMEAYLTMATASTMKEMPGEPSEEIEAAKKELEKKHDEYIEMCDALHDDKEQEIEDAYNEYMERQNEAKQASAIEKDENDPSLLTSLKL